MAWSDAARKAAAEARKRRAKGNQAAVSAPRLKALQAEARRVGGRAGYPGSVSTLQSSFGWKPGRIAREYQDFIQQQTKSQGARSEFTRLTGIKLKLKGSSSDGSIIDRAIKAAKKKGVKTSERTLRRLAWGG